MRNRYNIFQVVKEKYIFKSLLQLNFFIVSLSNISYPYLICLVFLMWSIEIGTIDIMTELSCLSQILCSPSEGHLNSVYNIFRYLQNNLSKNPGRVAFDPGCVHIDEKLFERITRKLENWEYF